MNKSFQIKNDEYVRILRAAYAPMVNVEEPHRAGRFGEPRFQAVRLEILWGIVSDCESVLDVGCGRAEFIEYIDNNMAYHGIDLVEEFITWLEEKRGHWPTPWSFECHDLRDEPRPAEAVIGSCLFALGNDEIFWQVLDAMWGSATKILAFNCKSIRGKPFEGIHDGTKEDLSYRRDPVKTIAECSKRYSQKILYRHDYFERDFTIAIYK